VAELGTRKAVLKGNFGRSLETTSGLASLVGSYIARGLSLDEIGRYQRSVSGVTPEQAEAAARSILAPDGATVVIVGDASKFLDRLRKERGEVMVIPLAKLDLDRLGEGAK
jgi:zinc protease